VSNKSLAPGSPATGYCHRRQAPLREAQRCQHDRFRSGTSRSLWSRRSSHLAFRAAKSASSFSLAACPSSSIASRRSVRSRSCTWRKHLWSQDAESFAEHSTRSWRIWRWSRRASPNTLVKKEAVAHAASIPQRWKIFQPRRTHEVLQPTHNERGRLP
jgi:hypothetical protein